MTIVDEKKIKELFCKPNINIQDSTKNIWKVNAEFVWLFCVVSFMLTFSAKAGNVVFGVVAIVLLVFGVFCTVFAFRHNKKVKNHICDDKASYVYSVLYGTYVERTPHSNCDDTTYTYDFKVNNKVYTFDEMPVFGRKTPTDEFAIVKIIFTFANGNKAERIYAFSCKEFKLSLPKEKMVENAFCFSEAFGLATFVS